MFKKSFAFLLFCTAFFQITYNTKFIEAVSRPLLHTTHYAIFTEEFRSFILLLSLLVLFSTAFFLPRPALNQKNSRNCFWELGFLGLLFLSSTTVIYVNPQGHFPWSKHDNYIEIEVRSRKPDLYKKLAHTPDLILFGSSVSWLTPMDYFEEKWGLQAFNMSVNGGGPADFVNLINTIKKISPDSKMPKVVMIEILNPGLALNKVDQTPVEYIPDIVSIVQQKNAVWTTTKNIFRINTLSDALFMVFIVDKGHWNITETLTANGTMIQSKEDVKDKQYRNWVEKSASILDTLQSCKNLDEGGKLALERLIQLSRQYKFSLLIYRTPINQDFYMFSNYDPSAYSKCAQLFNEYLEDIAAQNPNVFFKDLTQYQEIATGGKEMYTDAYHMTRRADLLLMDALDNEIDAAIRWAKDNR